MFYETAKGDHGLPRNPFKACVVPRPIGWITSQDAQGRVNLAPYSFFNAVADDPPQVVFASNGTKPAMEGRSEEGPKDSVANVEETGAFVANLATWDLRWEMVKTSAPLAHGEEEAAFAGLELLPSRLVAPPRVAAAPIHLECRLIQVVDLPCGTPGHRNALVIGEVVGIHIDDGLLVEGRVDLTKAKPIARLGYLDYAAVTEVFAMARPKGAG
ncbi:MAG: flavin reductase family protein [Pseudomonadota bacterium]